MIGSFVRMRVPHPVLPIPVDLRVRGVCVYAYRFYSEYCGTTQDMSTPQSQPLNVWRDSYEHVGIDIARVRMSRNWHPPAKGIILQNSM